MQPLSTLTSSAEDSPANPSAQPLEDVTTQSTSGRSSSESLEKRARVGLLLRTSLASEMTELSGCAAILSVSDTPYGRLKWILRHEAGAADERVSSGWPTPTATAGRTTPRLWEWMMGYPAGWTGSLS